VVLSFCALGLAGCSTLSVEERTAACANTDWYRFGVNDGTLGVPVSERTERFTDCAELGRPADVASYQAGRAEGLKEYCTAENGYDVGYRGRRYERVCPPELEPDFLQGYAEGRDDRPAYALYPGLGIGIGSGGVHTGVGIGIGVGGWHYRHPFYDPFYSPFPRRWGRYGLWGYPYGCGPFGRYRCW
jgi:hypothetical protein